MLIHILKSKLHNFIVTDANLEYEGSVSIDANLMNIANIRPNEQVHIYNKSNGARIITYAIPSDKSSEICINGAAARHFEKGDKVIIAAYAIIDENEQHVPNVIYYGE